MIQVTFVMEQHIGHRAYYENLRELVEEHDGVQAHWVEVTYRNPGHVWERMNFIPQGLVGPMIGRSQVRKGLRKGGEAFFFNTQVPAVLAGDAGQSRPFIIATDITPIQYDAMGEHYGHRSNEARFLKRYKHHRNVEVFNQAAYICPWSSWVMESLVNDYGVDERKVKVIHPGINLKKWLPDPSRKGGWATLFGDGMPGGAHRGDVRNESPIQGGWATLFEDGKPGGADCGDVRNELPIQGGWATLFEDGMPGGAHRGDMRNELPIQGGSPLRVLFVGGDFERKGGELLLQAYQVLSRQYSPDQVELVLVTRSAVPSSPGVKVFSHFEPNSPELVRLYQSSDVFVLPTYAEAFGIAAVEANATGLPVIATRVGGLVDIVEDGRSGFLIEPGELQPLIDKLAFLIENQQARVEMGAAARSRAEKLFDASQNAAQVLQLLQEIVH